MARPTAISRNDLSLAIRRVRLHFPDTQEKFARRLGVSLTSVAHYETNNKPTTIVLGALRELARELGIHEALPAIEEALGYSGEGMTPIRAASQLYDAVKLLVMLDPPNPFSHTDARHSAWFDMFKKAQAALAKAEGRA